MNRLPTVDDMLAPGFVCRPITAAAAPIYHSRMGWFVWQYGARWMAWQVA